MFHVSQTVRLIGAAVLGLALATMGLTASGSGLSSPGRDSCTLDGYMSQWGISLTGQVGQASIDAAAAVKLAQAEFPTAATAEVRLGRLNDPTSPLASGHNAWMMRLSGAEGATPGGPSGMVPPTGKPIAVCTIVVIDADTGALLYRYQQSRAN